MTVNDLVPILKERLSKFICQVVDEDLMAHNTSYLRYDSENGNWIAFPQENIRVITIAGVETKIFSTDYTVNAADGYVTFAVARGATDIIRADYWISPFTDAQLLSILGSALKQIRVVTFHAIDETNFSVNYSEAIIKKAYTIAMREFQFVATKYFAINIAGRTIDKSVQVTLIETLITSNEKDVLQDINAIRYFDRTNVIT